MRVQNGILEDISAVIGFHATTRLVALFGEPDRPRNLLIPVEPVQDHPITLAIGLPAMRMLVREWGGQVIALCANADEDHAWLVRAVAAMIGNGMPAKKISGIIGRTERQVRRLRSEAEELGLLPLVLKAGGKRVGSVVDVVV